METNKVKLLNNYQLYQLAQNELLDQETLTKVRQEFVLRNVSTIELKKLQQKYDTELIDSRKDLDANYRDPFYTAFAWRKHLRHLALLKTQGSKSDAKRYQTRFYLGVFIYLLIFVCLFVLYSKISL